jgi:hypothetical protein
MDTSDDPIDERTRRGDRIRQWTDAARLEGHHDALTDRAALLIALGRVDETTRQIVLNRLRSGRLFPSIGGFGELRLLCEEITWLDGKLEGLRVGPTRLALQQRRAHLARKYAAAESTFELSDHHYARGVRAIRKDRRDGVHLDLEQRSALFAALTRTPTPLGLGPGPFDRAREIVAGVAAERLEPVGRGVPELARAVAGKDADRFADRFDTMLFLAGTYHDRIQASKMWRSEVFAIQRSQLDVGEELIQISIDVTELADVETELTAAFEEGDARDEVGRREVLLRKGDLIPVWDQLVDRVAALSRIVDQLVDAERDHRTLGALQRTVDLDGKIGDLIARSGSRELSADNTHNVGDQIDKR